jgi:transcriptional regulator with XRE-family HTH domain
MCQPVKEPSAQEANPKNHGDVLRRLRRTNNMSRAQLASAAGLSRKQITAFERGNPSLSDAELGALADALRVEVTSLTPPGCNLAVAAGVLSNGAVGELRGEAAFDALLREYLSMVLELRNGRHAPASSLRQDDLSELARALGGSPEAIEARLIDLLGTDEQEAWQLRATILPSLGDAPAHQRT